MFQVFTYNVLIVLRKRRKPGLTRIRNLSALIIMRSLVFSKAIKTVAVQKSELLSLAVYNVNN